MKAKPLTKAQKNDIATAYEHVDDIIFSMTPTDMGGKAKDALLNLKDKLEECGIKITNYTPL